MIILNAIGRAMFALFKIVAWLVLNFLKLMLGVIKVALLLLGLVAKVFLIFAKSASDF